MHCEFSQLAMAITEIRTVAETVRTYGAVGPGDPGLSLVTAEALHVLAARFESHMRALAQVDVTLARHFTAAPGAVQIVEFPELLSVVTTATPFPVGADIQVAELRDAAARLRAAVDRCRTAMGGRLAEGYVGLLEMQVATIEGMATELE